ncbi:MAG: carboxylating nicotinate-nucleotide diphosphorylase [Akkermansiaceae bacterium]|nr:carboxylating nicotinate-nucleotide diphosphorylase [Akkermansiaceae bacterium]
MTAPELAAADALISLALAEDLDGRGDITSQHFIPANHRSLGRIMARQSLALCGVEVSRRVFATVDPDLEIHCLAKDGDALERGQTVLTVVGSTQSILSAERTALNFLQRLSGVATLTRRHVSALAGSKTKLLDTRKTTPGWRLLEKAAVRAGGGVNHRIGLHDAVMVKDNHLVAGGTVDELRAGIDRVRGACGPVKIEVEADRLDQVRAFLTVPGIDVILLDNMGAGMLREAVALRNAAGSAILLEASGGVTLETLSDLAATGVDFISVGALTHSATAVDLALDLETLPAS